MRLPPATARLLVGLLCLHACAVPGFVGDDDLPSTGGAEASSGSASGATTDTGEGTTAGEVVTTGDEPTTADASAAEPDLPEVEPPPQCQLPAVDCDEGADDLALALGLGCGSVEPIGPMELAGPPASRIVVSGLGAGPTFAPRLGGRAVVLSTGVAAHASLTKEELKVVCSEAGLSCPSTEYDAYDLEELPAPLDPTPVDCPEGQVPPPGDCSDTIEAEWKGMPRLAHDYTELRFSTLVPDYTIELALSLAFLTAEWPPRFPGGHNDLLVVWLESEHWTGNIAIHPDLLVPLGAETLTYTYTKDDPELADFAFAGHAATEWFTISAPVIPGETITVVIALFDGADGVADSAVLLDGLQWVCNPANLGGTHP